MADETREALEDRIRRAVREPVEIVPYDPAWPEIFEAEAEYLRGLLSSDILRIEHFGSTAIPGLAAKPIIDIIAGVESDELAKERVAPILEADGYEYFWRTDVPKPYAWCIKRDAEGRRTHHIHIVPLTSTLWECLRFRDYLREHPDVAARYAALKRALAADHSQDREAYTHGKSEFIAQVMNDIRALDDAGTADGDTSRNE